MNLRHIVGLDGIVVRRSMRVALDGRCWRATEEDPQGKPVTLHGCA